ncbi:MAG: NUDIX hydrolase [Acidaminococcales bacterium]|jgi:ADP-ribose pyrophosphatase YjhB (NUDIX family)|nr:NUDIX hydrolase [Acidaminococcales bacterium]
MAGKIARLKCTRCRKVAYENPIVGVAGMVFDPKGRILMVRRGRGATCAGLWCIPCGYVEYEEDVRAAAVRELQEETGLSVRTAQVFAVHSNFHDPAQHTVGIWFLCDVLSGQVRPGDDADRAEWFSPEDPPPLAFPTDKLVLGEWTEKAKKSKPRREQH